MPQGHRQERPNTHQRDPTGLGGVLSLRALRDRRPRAQGCIWHRQLCGNCTDKRSRWANRARQHFRHHKTSIQRKQTEEEQGRTGPRARARQESSVPRAGDSVFTQHPQSHRQPSPVSLGCTRPRGLPGGGRGRTVSSCLHRLAPGATD